MTMCEHYTRTQLNRRLTFCAFMACAFAAGMAYAVESVPRGAIDAAERADRLGAVGILALGFGVMTCGFLGLVRFIGGRGLIALEKSTEASTKAAAAMDQAALTMGRVIDAIKDCEHARRR